MPKTTKKPASGRIYVRINRPDGHRSTIDQKLPTAAMFTDAEQLATHLTLGTRELPPGMTPNRIKELAQEAAECIWTNQLDTVDALVEYLHPFFQEIFREAAVPKSVKEMRAKQTAKKGRRGGRTKGR